MPIENYGLIGNMNTCALVATDGAVDFMCWPDFDSPTVFCRLLDKEKGGYFTIAPKKDKENMKMTTKQTYRPASNILRTRCLLEDGAMDLVDFFPRPHSQETVRNLRVDGSVHETKPPQELKHWLVRRVECIRNEVEVEVDVFPAFNYARDTHVTWIDSFHGVEGDGRVDQKVVFKSETLQLELNATVECCRPCDLDEGIKNCVNVVFEMKDEKHYRGAGVTARFKLLKGQTVSFVLREHRPGKGISFLNGPIDTKEIEKAEEETMTFWTEWILQSTYTGRWRETVNRSLLILKMLTYEKTGAIVAAPTFSLPELIGGERNWDYRYSWVRDSSFVVYTFLRMGFMQEAEDYINFIDRALKNVPGSTLPIMFDIHARSGLLLEQTLDLSGYRDSRPVLIGNKAAGHQQLDVYGELMDAVYTYDRWGKPVTYSHWKVYQSLTDQVCKIWRFKDKSIWEVRGPDQNFVYSKILLWVAVDRALRLAENRRFPCPDKSTWERVRNEIYEEVMEKGYVSERGKKFFCQSYERPDRLDASLLIAPLVFFIAPNDPRFTNTLEAIMTPYDRGGLLSTDLVYRPIDTAIRADGLHGSEGAFSICTFWLVEALARAGAYNKAYISSACVIFEGMLAFGNHVDIFSEEISPAGEQLGNTPQAFSHLALIRAAFVLDRIMDGKSGD
ncbi:glycoside hydrolase family 15 protein [Aulographum hederae CBS 113979]|uniref:Glycoside hydrolase family 15 protein n=1 Tax=Aulographum hederae CBS 113979 TaxID=1176131 RepID=A0A6G1GU24_9PEZI|nr:glycoside hydrolase family 15 protein [Aulographum hederae CBS 113979]